MSSTLKLPGFELQDREVLLCVKAAQEAGTCSIHLCKWLDVFIWQPRFPLGAGVIVGCKPDAWRLVLWASTLHSSMLIPLTAGVLGRGFGGAGGGK